MTTRRVNIERLNILADYLEKPLPETRVFNMTVFGDFVGYGHNQCQTAACIAGHAVILFADIPDDWNMPSCLPAKMSRAEAWVGDPDGAIAIGEMAAELLGLDPATAVSLFVPYGVELDRIKPNDAARTLRHFAKTGEVDWSDFTGWLR